MSLRPYHGDPEAFPCAVSFCLCEVVACTLSCPRNGAVNSHLAVLPVAPRQFRKKKRRRDGEMLASYARAPAPAAYTNARIGNRIRSLSGYVGVQPPDFGGSLQRITRPSNGVSVNAGLVKKGCFGCRQSIVPCLITANHQTPENDQQS